MDDEKGFQEVDWKTRFDSLNRLNAIVSTIEKNFETESVITTAADAIIKYLPQVISLEIYLYESQSKSLHLKCFRELPEDFNLDRIVYPKQSIQGEVAHSGEPLYLEDLSQDNHIPKKVIKKSGITAYLCIPLSSEDHFWGVVGLYTKNSSGFSKHDQVIFKEMGQRIGVALDKANQYEIAATRTKRFITISRAITVTRQLGTLDEVLQDFSKVLVQSLGFDQTWIGLIDNGDILKGKAGFGIGLKKNTISVEYEIKKNSKNPAVQCLLEHQPAVYKNIEEINDAEIIPWLTELNTQSIAFIPILSGEKSVGVIGVFYVTPQVFEEEDIKTLKSVSEQATIAIENAQLYEQVKMSGERYRTLFESAGNSLVILDTKLDFRIVNDAFSKLSGYTLDELKDKQSFSAFLDCPDLTQKQIEEKLKAPPQSWEMDFIDKQKMRKHVHLTTTSIYNSQHILVSLTDMTRQRDLERRLFRSEELASIGELSAGIAHEIRNPLVAITTSVNLLKDEPSISPEGRQLLDVVKEESDHLAVIVDDFLRFAKPKEPDFEEEDINQLLIDVVKRHRDWNENDITWNEKYDKSIPKVFLDRHQFQQVITNLIMNSIDAMSTGGKLNIQTKKEKNYLQDAVRILISDSGIGIPENDLAKIFQPFYSMKEKGTGMGLAICQRIIDSHDGEILVESEQDNGTTFSIILPVHGKKQ